MSGTKFGGIVIGILLFIAIAAYMSIGRDGAVEIINEAATLVPSLAEPGSIFGGAHQPIGPTGDDSEEKPKPRSTRRRTEQAKAEPTPAPVPPVAYQPPVERPIPAPTTDLLGMSSRDLTRNYGAPAISASTVTSDSLVETQVFMDDTQGAATILRLENGVVIEVQKGVN